MNPSSFKGETVAQGVESSSYQSAAGLIPRIPWLHVEVSKYTWARFWTQNCRVAPCMAATSVWMGEVL